VSEGRTIPQNPSLTRRVGMEPNNGRTKKPGLRRLRPVGSWVEIDILALIFFAPNLSTASIDQWPVSVVRLSKNGSRKILRGQCSSLAYASGFSLFFVCVLCVLLRLMIENAKKEHTTNRTNHTNEKAEVFGFVAFVLFVVKFLLGSLAHASG
jgi:hypothetical protein